MIRMPQWMKDKWVAALRSGEYKQGRNILKNDINGTYCCLGVLQHVLDGDVERTHCPIDHPADRSSLPLGLPSGRWTLDKGIELHSDWVPRGTSYPLYSLNDRGEHTFAEIADIIEKGVEGY